MNDNGHFEILVAEDSPTQAEQLKQLLEEHQYSVSTAANGKDALAQLALHQPALVISDVVMPELDGYGLCKAIKSDEKLKHIPVILVTTLSDPNDVIRGLECGADNFIRKPYRGKYLLSRIEQMRLNLELRKNQRMQMALEINLGGHKHFITSERQQILDLLISTYEQAVDVNAELKQQGKDLAHSNQMLLGLNRIAGGLNSAVSEREVAETALRYALELPEIHAGWISLRTGEAGFSLAAACGVPPALSGPDAFEGDCACRQQLLNGELSASVNIIKCERLAKARGDMQGLCYHACVPLYDADGRAMGVMNLAGRGNNLFSEDELKILHSVGNQVAVALERARLHDNLETLVAERTAKLTAEIEERKRVEREQARLVAIIETTPDFIGTVTPDGQLLYSNAAGLRMMGLKEKDLSTVRLQDIHPEWARKLVQEEGIPHALNHGYWSGETAILGADDRELPVLQVILTHTASDGTVEHLSTIARDITQIKTSEAKIARLNRIYAVLSGINTTIVRVNDEDELFREACRIAVEHGQFAFVWIGKFDASSRRVTPVSQAGRGDEYLAQINLIVDEGIAGSCALTTEALTEVKPVVCNDIASDERIAPWRSTALELGYRSAAMLPLVVEARPFGVFALYSAETDAFDDEEMKLLIEMSGDISYALDNLRLEARRKQAETALFELNESLEQRVAERTTDLECARREAEHANRVKSAFLAAMSHEIRTPMNGVLGLVDVLAHSKLSEHQSDLVGTIQESAGVLLGIIDDILDFSKIEAERLELEQAPISVADLVEGLCNSLVPVATRQRVDLLLFVSPELPERVLSDDVRLRQVLYNLIGNAIKFSSGRPNIRGRVSVRVELATVDPLRLRFTISDNGVGIGAETIEDLFTPFAQAEVSTTRRYGGTGLGLAICKRLVDLMGGTIEVDSTPGKGSTFTVTLALKTSPEQPQRIVPDVAGVVCVLVDSEEFEAADLRVYLEHAGAQVRVTPDVESAARLCAELNAPVVVIRAGQGRRLGQFPVASGDVRQVVITRGRRRRARIVAPDMVTLDGDALRRGALLRAVAVATGRASPEVFHEDAHAPLPGVAKPLTVAQARDAGRLILVAEDDVINQKVILQQLALLGHAAEVASDGAEALQMWRNGDYALLLTDLHMPGMDGYTLSETIRSEEEARGNRHIPIVALTANALRGEAHRTLAAGMNAHLTKPIQLPRLREALGHWLPRDSRDEAETPPQNPPASEGNRSAVDPDVLRQLVGDDDAVVRDLLSNYLEVLETRCEELRQAFSDADLEGVGRIAHMLKSSSRAVGALALSDLCAELENSGKLGDGKAIAGVLATFDVAVAAVRSSVLAILSKQDPPPVSA